eukprot:scaffold164308_cov58-Attheya_sp.AAC.1
MRTTPLSRRFRLTVERASRLLALHQLTSRELALYCHELARYGEEQLGLNAFAHLLDKHALLEAADASDKRRNSSSSSLSVLDGIPVSIKANIAVRDQPLTAGSRILMPSTTTPPGKAVPCGYDSDVARRLLRQSGAILMGMTHMDEFGMGSLGTNVVMPPSSSDINHSTPAARTNEQTYNFTKNPLPFFNHESQHYDPIHDDEDAYWIERIKEPMRALEEWDKSEVNDDYNEDGSKGAIYSAGGSSCGSAASVCFGSSLVSIGTDTGGSVRLPAAWCGIVGLKPSYGAIARHGVVSYASSLDTVGILAPTSKCAATVLNCLLNRTSTLDSSNPDDSSSSLNPILDNYETTRDSTAIFYPPSLDLSPSNESKSNSETDWNVSSGTMENDDHTDLIDIKIGIPAAFSVSECPGYVKDAWERAADILMARGADIEIIPDHIISPDIIQHSLAAYYVLACAEASSNLSRYDGVRYGLDSPNLADLDWGDDDNDAMVASLSPFEQQVVATRIHGFGPEVVRRILCGTAVLSSDRFHTHYEAATKLRSVVVREFQNALDRSHNDRAVDLLLIPTALSLPPTLMDSRNGVQHPVDSTEMFANDVMTVPISLAGLPSISLPIPILQDTTNMNGYTPSVERAMQQGLNTVGLQIVGQKMQEKMVLRAALTVENELR